MRYRNTKKAPKLLLVTVLCLALLLGLGMTALAADTHSDHSTWTALTAGTLTSGNYYLDDKTVLDSSVVIPAGTEVTICLNGNMLIGGENLKTSIFSVAGTLHICDCTRGGTLTAGTAENGGAFYVDGGTLTVQDVIISGCNATAKGGVIYATGGASISITTGASVSGSAVDGGVIYATGTGTTVTIEDANLFKGVASGNGGGVYLAGGATLQLGSYGEIETATAVNGGGIYATGTGTTVTIEDATLSQNRATNGGGVYLAAGATCTMQDDAAIERCGASGNGGAIYVDGGALTMETARLKLNTAANGAGIALQAGTASLLDATITENTASGNGGAIYTTGAGTLSVVESAIRDNAAENGGGLYLAANGAGSTLLQEVTFRGNSATAKGGGLYSNGAIKLAGRVRMQNTGTVANNTAGESGSGAYLDANGQFVITEDISGTIISVNTTFATNQEKQLTSGLATYHPDEEITKFFAIEVNSLFQDLTESNAGEAILRNITYTATLANGTYFGMDYNTTDKLQDLLSFVTIKQKIGNNTPAVIGSADYTISLVGAMAYDAAGVTIDVQILNNVRLKVASFTASFVHKLEMPKVEGTYMFPDATYNGKEQTRNNILCDGISRDATWMESLGITLQNNKQTNANTYTIFTNDGDKTDANGERYVWASGNAKRATWVINPFELTAANVNFGSRFTFVYNGTTQGLTVSVNALGRGLTLNTEYRLTDATAVNWKDGGYTATVQGVGNFTGTITRTWEIQKANYDMSGVVFENATFPYNGRLQRPSATGLPNGLQVQEYIGGATNVSESGAVVTVVFKTTNPNYNVPASRTARVYITPLAVTESNVSFTSLALTYNGAEQAVTVRSATVNGLPVTYTLTGNTATNYKDGGYTLTFTANGNFTGSFQKKWSIAKANYDMSGLSLTGKEFPYDGQSHTIVLVGTLPTGVDGITLRAQSNNLSVTNVADGTKTVEITFATDSANYNVPAPMRATIKVTPLVLTEAHVTFGQTQFSYTGAANTVTVNVAQINGLDVTHTVTGQTATNYREGGYTVKVTANGNFTGEVTKAWSIEKATYDLSEITFPDGVFVESGRSFNLKVEGALPAGVRVSYENNGQKTPGVYTVTAKFTGDANNYHPMADMTATLTVRIARLEYTMEGTDSTIPHAIIEALDGFAPSTVLTVEETAVDAYPDVDDILLIYHVATSVAPDGKVRVQLLVPAYFAEEEITFKLMHDNGEGLEEVTFESFSGSSYIELEVDRLGDFLFVEDKPVNIVLVIGLIAAVPVIGIVIAVATSKGSSGKKKSK